MTSSLILKVFIIVKIVEFLFSNLLEVFNVNNIIKNKLVPKRFQEFISAKEFQISRNYSIAKHKYSFFAHSFNFVVLISFVLLGGFGIVEKLCLNIAAKEEMQAIFFCFIISFGKMIIDLPFSIYHTFVLEKKFGFNKMTPFLFIKDMFKGIVLSLVLGAPLIYFLVWIINVAGSLWWVFGFVGMMVFQFFILWIYPTVIAPIFNKFILLEPGELRSKIEAISSKVNFPVSEIFTIDGSKRSTHSNAYFTGFGKNRRIVLFDTLIESLSTMELTAVLAHEMAHNKLNHIKKGIAISVVMTFLGFYIWSLLLRYPPLYQAFSLQGNNLFPALIIFPMIMGPLSFLLSPLFNILSRKHEYEADAFSAKAMGSSTDMRSALLKLNKDNLSNLTPHPWYSFFYYSHPTLTERLDNLESD